MSCRVVEIKREKGKPKFGPEMDSTWTYRVIEGRSYIRVNEGRRKTTVGYRFKGEDEHQHHHQHPASGSHAKIAHLL